MAGGGRARYADLSAAGPEQRERRPLLPVTRSVEASRVGLRPGRARAARITRIFRVLVKM